MRKLSSAACTLIAALALASTVGCHRAAETPPADTTAVVVAPATSDSTGTSGTGGSSGSGAAHGGSGSHGSSNAGHGAANTTTAVQGTNNAMPPPAGLKNNSGETQGTTPGTSLPTSDGAR
jgi:hypothetical protein